MGVYAFTRAATTYHQPSSPLFPPLRGLLRCLIEQLLENISQTTNVFNYERLEVLEANDSQIWSKGLDILGDLLREREGIYLILIDDFKKFYSLGKDDNNEENERMTSYWEKLLAILGCTITKDTNMQYRGTVKVFIRCSGSPKVITNLGYNGNWMDDREGREGKYLIEILNEIFSG